MENLVGNLSYDNAFKLGKIEGLLSLSLDIAKKRNAKYQIDYLEQAIQHLNDLTDNLSSYDEV